MRRFYAHPDPLPFFCVLNPGGDSVGHARLARPLLHIHGELGRIFPAFFETPFHHAASQELHLVNDSCYWRCCVNRYRWGVSALVPFCRMQSERSSMILGGISRSLLRPDLV